MNKIAAISVTAVSALIVGGVAGGFVAGSLSNDKVAAAEAKTAAVQVKLDESEAKYKELVQSKEMLEASLKAFESIDMDAYARLMEASGQTVTGLAENAGALKELMESAEKLISEQ